VITPLQNADLLNKFIVLREKIHHFVKQKNHLWVKKLSVICVIYKLHSPSKCLVQVAGISGHPDQTFWRQVYVIQQLTASKFNIIVDPITLLLISLRHYSCKHILDSQFLFLSFPICACAFREQKLILKTTFYISDEWNLQVKGNSSRSPSVSLGGCLLVLLLFQVWRPASVDWRNQSQYLLCYAHGIIFTPNLALDTTNF
jgi:hypothetical protein